MNDSNDPAAAERPGIAPADPTANGPESSPDGQSVAEATRPAGKPAARKRPLKSPPAKQAPVKKVAVKKVAQQPAADLAAEAEPTAAKPGAANPATTQPASGKPAAAKPAPAQPVPAKPARRTPARPEPAASSVVPATPAEARSPATKRAAARAGDQARERSRRRRTAPIAATNSTDREFDIVVYGATGFVGRFVVEYLAQHAPSDVRIALAGRSSAKLLEVRSAAPAAAQWPIITADSANETSLTALAASTRVVITTVGPYLKYGLPLVAACAEQGTHYLDLAGEVLFMRRSIDAFDATARATGAKIIHAAGFDSIPSDLGVFALHDASLRHGDGGLGVTKMAVVSLRGGVSGGTIASALAQLEAVEGDPSLARVAADPYALSPDRGSEPSPGDGRDFRSVAFDHDLRSWVSPFVMAMINARVVRRSNALLGYAYSRDFRYQEVLAHGAGPIGLAGALAVAGGTLVGSAALARRPTRSAVQRFLPKPGTGPGEDTRRNGRFAIRLLSTAPDGTRYRGLVAGQGDPGYQATALMIGQSALALVLDADKVPTRAGVLTPATGLGQAGIDRLVGAGMTINAYPM